MKIERSKGSITITLSERNLRALLVKLDDPESLRTIYLDDDEGRVFISAQKDADHYAALGRSPGLMHPRTEEMLS